MQQRKSGPDPTSVSQYLSVGLTSALSTALFAYLGLAADRRFDTEPLLTLLGALVGAGAGFYHMYHHLVVVPRDRKRDGSG
ncbi:MAG TPA: AtpZ/AtpI family protein [Longimicrobiales bacterium]|nr:AtpZ/AtpI family protein [Longimicrobiales bacterium]